MLAGTGFKDTGIAAGTSAQTSKPSVPWTPNAEKRLENVPFFVRSLARAGIEQYARENEFAEVNDRVMDEYREKVGM
ncbi:MAG: protochlorophyllide oxidoreductase [Nitrospirae bacterium]|nr:protochlorophyllide oxidoreductase [Nitrospirota bacterium]